MPDNIQHDLAGQTKKAVTLKTGSPHVSVATNKMCTSAREAGVCPDRLSFILPSSTPPSEHFAPPVIAHRDLLPAPGRSFPFG